MNPMEVKEALLYYELRILFPTLLLMDYME